MISKSKVLIVFIILFYLIFLLFIFDLMSVTFKDVEGYGNFKVDSLYFLLSGIMLILASFLLPTCINAISNSILWLVYFYHVIPSVFFFHAVTQTSLLHSVFFTAIILVAYVFFANVILRLNCGHLKLFLLDVRTSFLIFGIFVVISFLILLNDFGFSLKPPSIYDVYGLRAEYKDNVSLIGGYAAIFNGYVFSPILMFFGFVFFKKNKFIYALLCVFISLVLSYHVYASAGFKSVAFMSFTVLIYTAIFFIFNKVDFGTIHSMVFFVVVGVASIFYIIGFEDIALHWVRRSLIMPGINSAYYYLYQISYGFDNLIPAPLIISNFYYGTTGSANTGLIGDGIYRYGIHFFWINIFYFVLSLKLIDIIIGYRSRMFSSLFVPAAYAFANSSITTVFVTYGFFLVLFFIFIFNRVVIDE